MSEKNRGYKANLHQPSLIGGDGDDSLEGGDGNDSLIGGNGDDFLFGQNGDDTLFGQTGNDTLHGGQGNDILEGGAQNDTLNGNDGNDTLRGGAQNDILNGNDGNDILEGGSQNDQLKGHDGNDLLFGQLGNDTLKGGDGDDSLEGDDGDDSLNGNEGDDSSNITLGDNQGLGTINNDDNATININNVTIVEGDNGTTNAVFTVSLSNPVNEVVTVDYTTADGTATVADNDYVPIPTTTLTFNPNETTQQITVEVNGDKIVENDETFFLNLSNLQTNSSNVTLGDNQGIGTINNDDDATIDIEDVTITEGDKGTTNFVFTVSLSNLVDEVVTVDYTTADVTATVADNDYVPIPTTTLTFNPEETTKEIIVEVTGDKIVENDETFFLNLSNLQTNSSNVTLEDNQGVGTIENDDEAKISIEDVTITEGDNGITNFVFTVSLSNLVDEVVTVDYATADGTATVADNDYVPIPTTTLTFNPNQTTQQITVEVTGDNIVEDNETFFLNLSNLQTNSSNVTLEDNQGVGTISNDDNDENNSAPTEISLINGFVLNGIDQYDFSGRSVSSAGDVNGDGFSDILIGAYHADPNGNSRAGESYVVFGRSNFVAVVELSNLNTANVDENSANGTVIAQLNTSDPDAGDTHTYNLLDDAGGRFAINENNHLIVANGSLLDFETDNSHTIEVQTTDSGGMSFSQFLTIDLKNSQEIGNDQPSSISLINGFGFVLNGIDAGDRSGYSGVIRWARKLVPSISV